MKKTLVNLGAILAAFLIGLAINNACADSLENMSDTELRKLVSQLQQEINSLKSRVAELEGKVSNGSGSSSTTVTTGMFNVDGLWFLPTGYVCGRVKNGHTVTTQKILTTGEITTTESEAYNVTTIDSYGRITKSDSAYLSSGFDYYYTDYSYSGKTVTTVTAYKTSAVEYRQESTQEYY